MTRRNWAFINQKLKNPALAIEHSNEFAHENPEKYLSIGQMEFLLESCMLDEILAWTIYTQVTMSAYRILYLVDRLMFTACKYSH